MIFQDRRLGQCVALIGALALIINGSFVSAWAQQPAEQVGVEEKLGQMIPLDTVFND